MPNEEVCAAKPEGKIFEFALQKDGSIGPDVLRIGDGLLADSWGSKNVGVNQIFSTQKMNHVIVVLHSKLQSHVNLNKFYDKLGCCYTFIFKLPKSRARTFS